MKLATLDISRDSQEYPIGPRMLEEAILKSGSQKERIKFLSGAIDCIPAIVFVSPELRPFFVVVAGGYIL